MNYAIEFEREDDGRWIADFPDFPGVMTYGATQCEARASAEQLLLSVLEDSLVAGSS